MKPLKIAFLWHQHQPEYKYKDSFLLPWTRFHGVKDYFDIPEILHEFPELKQTFNIVPSMMKQIIDFTNNGIEDEVLRLTKIPAEKLSNKDKENILKKFFLCNEQNLIFPYERFKDLFDKKDKGIEGFSNQDFLDLQVWYNLTWIGEFSRTSGLIKRLFHKGKNYSESDKNIVIDEHMSILKKIANQYKSLQDFGQVELSCSPFYHPILPLVIDSNSALEAMPGIDLPEPNYKYPEDADIQIKKAKDFFVDLFGKSPNGFWPSEGSISDEALAMLADNEINWAASDEQILKDTFKGKIKETDKFFPRKFKSDSGEITLFFRDHFLSDRIGFVYSNWGAWDAANDFTHHLLNIRNQIIKEQGEEALEHAVVSVILDGENCWEFYKDNGIHFLRALFERITEENLLTSTTFSESIANGDQNYLPSISHIKAGSWINANFSIWIGHEHDRRAWEMLSKVRKLYDNKKHTLSDQQKEKALEEIMIAEGSDWFWWYGPEHHAENKDDFDTIFRWHIQNIYEIMGVEVPKDVFKPIAEQNVARAIQKPKAFISPDFNKENSNQWEDAGIYNPKIESSAMHQVGDFLDRVYFGRNDKYIFLNIKLKEQLSKNNTIKIQITESQGIALELSDTSTILKSESLVNEIEVLRREGIQIKLPKDIIDLEHKDENMLFLRIITQKDSNEIIYPKQGFSAIKF